MSKGEAEAKRLDPSAPPQPRGGDRKLAAPVLALVAAFVAALGAFFWDSCQGDAPEALEGEIKVTSSAEEIERVMHNLRAGEVPALESRHTDTKAPQAKPAQDNASGTEQGAPEAAAKDDAASQEGDDRRAQDGGAPNEVAAIGEERQRQAQVMERERLELLQQALQGSSRVELAATGESPVSGQPDVAAGPAGLGDRLADIAGGQSYMEKLAALKQAGLIGSESGGREASKGSEGYAQFAGDGEADRWALGQSVQRTPPYSVLAGAVIPATLQTAIGSDLPGPITALVAQDVRDTTTGNYVLIPQGARLLGAYSADVSRGQDRLLVAWQRLVFPNGAVLDLGAMPGADGAGQAGLSDQVETHFWSMFSSALLMSVVTGSIGLSQGQGRSSIDRQTVGDAMSQSLGQQLGQLSEEMIGRHLDVSPTLQIRPGYRLNVSVTKDLVFDGPYEGQADEGW